jgi:hypothetical protein
MVRDVRFMCVRLLNAFPRRGLVLKGSASSSGSSAPSFPGSAPSFPGSAPSFPGAAGAASGITFDRFVRACVVVKQITESFQRLDTDRDGWVQINYDQFMSTVLSLP